MLPRYEAACNNLKMVAVRALRRFLLLFSLLGVVLAPASVGTAMAAMAASSADGMNMADVPQAVADMSCCPDEEPVGEIDCGKPCPLALICSTSIIGSFDPAMSWKIDFAASKPSYDPLRASLHRSSIPEPPARPPKA